MTKKILSLLLMVMILSQFAFAFEAPILVRVNDNFIASDSPHIIVDNQVYVVARTIADGIGAITEWYEPTAEAHFYKFNKRLVVQDEKVTAYIDDAPIVLEEDIKIIIQEGRVYVPVRFFVEFFEHEVTWYEKIQLVSIQAEDAVSKEEVIVPAPELKDDLLWLARIINIEARGGSLYKKIAVGNVVMNRVNSSKFPNTVYDVIKANGQFPPAYYSYFDTFEPNLSSYAAAMHAMNGINVVEDCLYFNLKPFSWKPKEDFYKEIEGDYFYK